MRQFTPGAVLLVARLRILRNRITDFRSDSLVKAAVIVIGLAGIICIASIISYYCLSFIEGFFYGPELNSRLLGVLFMVLFTMVTVSTAIVAYTSLFLAKETAFFFEHPLPPRAIFFFKAIESMIYSGWATLVLCVPVLISFGILRQAPPLYYVEAIATLVLFVIFCGVLGTLLTVVLGLVVRRWTLQKLAVTSLALVAVVTWGFLKSFDFASFNGEDNLLALNRFTMKLTALESSFLPSTWATTAVLAASNGHHSEVLFQLKLLLANALIAVPLFALYARRLYGRFWTVAAEPKPFWKRRERAVAIPRATAETRGPSTTPSPMAALNRKDFLTFIRAPAQVSQFVLFVILTVVYVLSLTQIPTNYFPREWRLVLYFSNVMAICLILSSFTSRFLFPLISLEGKAFWIVGLAPIERSYLIHQKVRFGRYLIVGLGAGAALCSGFCLRFEIPFVLSSVYLTVLCGWVLTALAVGFGAAYPNLNEDNPARIAVGLGGTLNFFASVVAVVTVILIEAVPYLGAPHRPSILQVTSSHLAALLFTVLISHVIHRVGKRALVAMDY